MGHQTDSSSVWNVKWKPLQGEAKPIQNTDFQFHSFDDYVLCSNWLCDEFILLNTFTKSSITCCKHDKYLVPILTRFFIGYTVLVITIRNIIRKISTNINNKIKHKRCQCFRTDGCFGIANCHVNSERTPGFLPETVKFWVKFTWIKPKTLNRTTLWNWKIDIKIFHCRLTIMPFNLCWKIVCMFLVFRALLV